MLTNELIILNRELSKTKSELKQKMDALKKVEKEDKETKVLL
jgi:hypothetical protein